MSLEDVKAARITGRFKSLHAGRSSSPAPPAERDPVTVKHSYINYGVLLLIHTRIHTINSVRKQQRVSIATGTVL